MNRDNPPGYIANRVSLRCNNYGRIQIPIRSRGVGTYILATDRPIAAPRIQGVLANGQQSRNPPYDFSTTGRPRANWLVWHQDQPTGGSSGFNVSFAGGQPGQTVMCVLWLAPPGTPRPPGRQWQPSDWSRHAHR